ncbi:MAG: 50S ribosomal protein L29 [Candidatus Cardinium sp.]|uniref:50S ribosomal protein L29 n=1 Tax=unclassified Candidatus Cardinium TaxID=2641185 RepID=UPI000E0D4E50|nr:MULTISPECIES: 50S ribosomal protein L29 [unclassified Candidatus Cardinium]AXI24498.1 L29: ribosomal protein uL29 [Cardinium endosymbiont of Sogatella furcifera]MCT4697062.1 50S ribosomal protein L29 [Candidatus Cardinium sp. TP]MDN5246644.1 50S ribosomal protein L29 [Candidatus Cardinium sp.]
MKYKDIQLLSSEECNDKLKEELDYLVKLRFAHSVSPIENPMKIRQTRKSIARLKTAQNSCLGQPSEL